MTIPHALALALALARIIHERFCCSRQCLGERLGAPRRNVFFLSSYHVPLARDQQPPSANHAPLVHLRELLGPSVG